MQRARKKFSKITLKNAWLPQHYMLRNRSGKPIQHVISFLVVSKRYLDFILAQTEEGSQRGYERIGFYFPFNMYF